MPQPLGPTSAMRFAVADRQADAVEHGRSLGVAEVTLSNSMLWRCRGRRGARLFSDTLGRRSIRAQIRSAAADARWILEWTLASLRIGSDAAASMA